MQQAIERLKAEFLKQMKLEEERTEYEFERTAEQYQQQHNDFQDRSEAVLAEARKEFEQTNLALVQRMKELEFKLVTRESRPEDVERIKFLEKEIAEKDFLARKIMEELKFFKAEAAARDEMLGLSSTPTRSRSKTNLPNIRARR